MSHTPTPWDLYNTEDCLISIPHTKGEFLLRVMDPASEIGDQEDYDNAAYIVKAVNSYQAMKEALIGLTTYAELVKSDITEQDSGWYYQFQAAIQNAGKALTLANGEKGDETTQNLINQVRHLHD